eukprot:6204218-Pleurochrysis_carterae.AAC.3
MYGIFKTPIYRYYQTFLSLPYRSTWRTSSVDAAHINRIQFHHYARLRPYSLPMILPDSYAVRSPDTGWLGAPLCEIGSGVAAGDR